MYMKKLFDSIISGLEGNKPVVLVSVIASSGSTPRGAGAMMAVFSDDGAIGTIGGGAIEFEAQKQAALMFDSKSAHITSYTLTKNDAADLGMICGGDVTLFYEYLEPGEGRCLELFRHMRAALDKNEDAWLVRRIESGKPAETAVFDGSGLHFANLLKDSDVKPLLGVAPGLSGGDVICFAEPLVRAGRVFVFGGGHVAQELVPLLSRVGFSVVVYEDRENFAREELFPDAAEIILGDFSKISERASVGETDYVVIMTRGHQNDYEVLEQMLRTRAPYVGCIGSAKKLDAVKRRLIDAGVPGAAFERLYSPIGLKIKAETPAEIAVSVTAEMIQLRAELCIQL